MEQRVSNNKLPHIFAIVLFFIISLTYFSPVLNGKKLVGNDTESWLGMSKEATDYNSANHEDYALWTDAMFGGMPTYQIAMNRPANLLTIASKTIYQLPRVVFTLFLYLLGFYILLICFKVNPWLSMAMALGFAFCSYNFIILAAGHDTKALAIAYMAPLIGSVIVTFRKNKWVGAVLTAIFLSLIIQANHLQILYYTLITLIIFGISESFFMIKEKKIKEWLSAAGLLLGALIIGVSLNATVLMTTKEYSDYTMRGKSNGLTIDKDSHQEGLNEDYITQWCYGKGETMTLLIPNFYGGASAQPLGPDSFTAQKLRQMGAYNVDEMLKENPMPTYWGDQPGTSGPVYAGAIICFLFVLGLILVDGRDKWWLLAATFLSVLLSWGHNFMPFTDFFIKHVPLYNMFRAVSMTLVITTFCMAFMAALGLKKFFSDDVDKKKKTTMLYISASVTGLLCLIFAFIPSLAGNFTAPIDQQMAANKANAFLATTLPQDRMDLLTSDAWRSFIFIALAFLVLFISTKTEKIKKTYIYCILGILIACDMIPVAKRYLNNDNFKEKKIGSYFEPSTADQLIMSDHSDYRVLDLSVDIWNSSKPAYFHKCIGGYNPAKMRRYQELINNQLNREIQNIGASFQSAQKAQTLQPVVETMAQCQVLNMLNMKYLIYNPDAAPVENTFANGNAWFVKKCTRCNTPDEEMLKLGTIDTKNELVYDKSFDNIVPKQLAPDATGTIELTSYEPNEIKYESNSKTDQVAVFSEIYYEKGWTAYVDGQESPYFRANYVLRAMPIKAGHHQIVFKFAPKSYYYGNIISGIASVILLAAIVALVVYKKKQNKKNKK